MGLTNLNITTGHHTRHLYSVQYISTLFPLLNLPIWYLMTLFIRFSEIHSPTAKYEHFYLQSLHNIVASFSILKKIKYRIEL